MVFKYGLNLREIVGLKYKGFPHLSMQPLDVFV